MMFWNNIFLLLIALKNTIFVFEDVGIGGHWTGQYLPSVGKGHFPVLHQLTKH